MNIDSIIPVSDEGLYPIRTVSELSGVNAITLRAWERRYNLFKPKRTPKGHRLYSDKDIQRIQQVLELLAKGVSIGRVAKALKEETQAYNYTQSPLKNTHLKNVKDLTNQEWDDHQETLLKKIGTYDVLTLEVFHHELLSDHGIETMSDNLIRPVLKTLNNRAKQLKSLSGSYYFYKLFLQHRMGGLFLKSSIRNSGNKVLLMAVDNNQCEIELLLFSMLLLKYNYQVIILGCDISFDAIPMTLNTSNAEALLLYSNDDSSSKIATSEFKTLVDSLSTPVFITGQYSEHQIKSFSESGIHLLPSNNKKQMEMLNHSLNKTTK